MMDLTTVTMKRLPSTTTRYMSTTYTRSLTYGSLHPFSITSYPRVRNHSHTRQFHSTRHLPKDFFPVEGTKKTHFTKPAWPHPIYTEEEINSIVVAHRNAKTWSDKIAIAAVRVMRFGLDTVTGYKHERAVAKGKLAVGAEAQPPVMTERKYMIRYGERSDGNSGTAEC